MNEEKPRLRWIGDIWACPGKHGMAYSYWWLYYREWFTWHDMRLEGLFLADRTAELLPR